MRQRTKIHALVKDALKFHIAARDGIAHDNEIRTRVKVVSGKGLGHRNAERSEEIRHWRICGRVRTGDAETALLQHPRE